MRDLKPDKPSSSLFISSRDFFSEKVEEGLSKRNLKTYPAVQSYLVELLQFYLDSRNLYETETSEPGQPSTLAEMYLKANTSSNSVRSGLLKRLADKSLYISGFFGDSLQRKLVDIDYYAQLGGAAYGSLAESVKEDTLAIVYRVFSQRFIDFVDVLGYISQQSMVQSDTNILRLYENYLRTGSTLAKDRLLEMGVLSIGSAQKAKAVQD